MKQTNTASHTHTTVGGGSNFRVFSCYSPWHWWQISTTSPRFTANPWGTSPLKRQMAAETHKTTGVSIRNNVSIKGGPSNNTHTQPPYSWAVILVCSFKTLGEMRNLCKTLHRRPCEYRSGKNPLHSGVLAPFKVLCINNSSAYWFNDLNEHKNS